MNRLQFFNELKKSLISTTKEVTMPLLSDELEKVDQIADQLVGIKWTSLEQISPVEFLGVQERFINQKAIIIFSNGEKLLAYEKVCRSCQTLVHYLAFEQTLKCFSCEKTFQLQTQTGDLTCKQYYIKELNGEWFIGM